MTTNIFFIEPAAVAIDGIDVGVLPGVSFEFTEQNNVTMVTILAELRGRLKHVDELFGLPVMTEEPSTGEIREEYPDQIEESFEQAQRALQRNRLP